MMEPNNNNDGDAVDAAFDDGAAEIFHDAEHDDDEDENDEDEDEDEYDDDDDDEEWDYLGFYEMLIEVFDSDELNQICVKVCAGIQQRQNFPLRIRTNMVRFAQQFLDDVRVDSAFDDNFAEIVNDEDHEDVDDEKKEDDDDVNDFEAMINLGDIGGWYIPRWSRLSEEDVGLHPAEINQLCEKVTAAIQQREKFPVRTRNKIVQLAHELLSRVCNDIHGMITEVEEVGYAGLDSDRDTEAEVSTALKFYPQLLSERDEFGYDLYPIECITEMCVSPNWECNVKAVPFVHLFASLAIKFNLFETDLRGGLLIQYNVLLTLVRGSSIPHLDDNHHRLADTTLLALLVRLWQSDLFKQEDIQRYNLLHELCAQKSYFAEQRFRYLTQMDPTALISIDNNFDNGYLPLHYATEDFGSIERFRYVFDTGMRYFPHKIGLSLIFRKNNSGETPVELACGKSCTRRNEVMDAVETTLAQYSSHSSTTPLNIRDALILAAIDERIHLNGLYFLMRRQPDTMLGMLHLHEELTPSSSAFRATYRNEDNDRGNTDSNT